MSTRLRGSDYNRVNAIYQSHFLTALDCGIVILGVPSERKRIISNICSTTLCVLIALPLIAVAAADAAFASPAPQAPVTPTTYTVQEMAGTSTASDPSGYVFSPAKLTIKVGDTVKWVDKSMPVPHNIVGKGNKVIRRRAITTRTYQVTFTSAGTYNYVCQIHPGMNGVIIVTH